MLLGDKEALSFWQLCRDLSLEEYTTMYKVNNYFACCLITNILCAFPWLLVFNTHLEVHLNSSGNYREVICSLVPISLQYQRLYLHPQFSSVHPFAYVSLEIRLCNFF